MLYGYDICPTCKDRQIVFVSYLYKMEGAEMQLSSPKKVVGDNNKMNENEEYIFFIETEILNKYR